MAERHRRSRPGFTKRGYGRPYHRARAIHMRDHPWCEMCIRVGRWTKATQCDHNETVRANPGRAADPSNFVSLCDEHHAILTNAYDKGDLRGACDADGLPLDPRHPWAQQTTEAAVATVNTPFTPRPPPPGLSAALKRRAIRGR